MKDTENKIKEFVKRVEDRTNDALDDSLLDEDAKTEEFDVDYTDIVKNSTKAKISKLPWLIAIFLILIISITLGLMFFSNNPKTLFTQTIDGLFSYLDDNVNDNVYDIMDGNISLDYNIKSNDENAEFYNNLSKVAFDADYVKDNAGNRSFIDLKTTYDGVDFVSAKIYGNGNDTYIYSPNVYDNYIKLYSNKLSYFGNGNDLKIILKGLNQAIDKVIADEKVYGGKEALDLNGKSIKTYKISLAVDKNNRDRVSENFINTLKANDELLNVLSNLKGVSSSDIKNSLDSYLLKLKNKLKDAGKFEVALYVNNENEFIKALISSDKENFSLTKENDKFSYSILKDGILTKGDFEFTVNDNKTKYTYNINFERTQGNKILLEGNIGLKYTSKKADSFEEVDVSSSVDISNITELEKLAIYTKILSTPNLSQFLPIIREII